MSLCICHLRRSRRSALEAAEPTQRSRERGASLVVAQVRFLRGIDDMLRHPVRYLIYVLWLLLT